MFCPKCGNELKENDVFCSKCGARVESSSPRQEKPTKKRKWVSIILMIAIIAVLAGVFILAPSNKEGKKGKSVDTVDITNAKVGDYITFGRYEQDNNTSNNTENIEWVVLAREKNRMLIVSRYILDFKEYGSYNDTTWETSSLRKWLNEEFYKKAFIGRERENILKVTNENPDADDYNNPEEEWIGKGGNPTEDNVFLLSYEELLVYFDQVDSKKCAPTSYALTQGSKSMQLNYESENACAWYLRSPGYNQREVMCVTSIGKVESVAAYWPIGVRPALWIDLDSLE